jgi:hypothetical protein
MAINRIPEFIESLRAAESANAVADLCKLEETYLDNELATSSKKRAFTRYRNAIKETFGDNHKALDFFRLSKKELTELGIAETKQVHTRHTTKRKERGFISANDLIVKAEELLDTSKSKRPSYIQVALGLMLLTGRRATEILKTAQFEKVSEFEVRFTGQLKTKDSVNAQTAPYVIPVLSDSDTIINALQKLRDLRDFSGLTNDEVHSRSNKSLNESVKRHFGSIIPNPSVKNLRQAYAAINLKWNYDESKELKLIVSEQQYLASILGHTEGDLNTANSYKDFADLIDD